MSTLIATANLIAKLSAAALFASDGDFIAAGVFAIAAPITSWIMAQ